MTQDEWSKLSIKAGKVFTPAAPVDERDLFAGRIEELVQVLDVVNQKGQHAIIFGERGVGKTSLANIVVTICGTNLLAVRKNCDSSDDYSNLWDKVFSEIVLTQESKKPGFIANDAFEYKAVCDRDDKITPETVRKVLTKIATSKPLIILDEFDRISQSETRAAVADTIKTLSDHATPATIILVGVADSVNDLIKEHLSIERALVQIKMPRMSNSELEDLLERGLKILKLTIEPDARHHITLLCQGLPHYAHLLALHSVRQAVQSHSKKIALQHVEAAISKALEQAQRTIQSAYHEAITSPRKDTIFAQVLLACALTQTDELGYFFAADVSLPLSAIMGKNYEVPGFSRHLNDFCDPDRGPILTKIGKIRRYRFRFTNPLMQPFVVMQGFKAGLIDKHLLESIKADSPPKTKSGRRKTN
jgi:Cdc6-like AAA superfamily ATPase